MSDDEPAPGGDEPRDAAAPPGRDRDPMGPPEEPCECWCMHCHRTFMSTGIWFQRVVGDPDGFDGFWMCPTPNCSGAGFTFDIFPTDPDHPANEGWHSSDGDDGDSEENEAGEGEFFEEDDDADDDDADAAWDPDESKWKELDASMGEPADDDDVEGEEWKHGLAPGERPPPRAPASWPEEARLEWEAEQRSYDEPDRRPRELDWSDREPRRRRDDQHFTEDDIPF